MNLPKSAPMNANRYWATSFSFQSMMNWKTRPRRLAKQQENTLIQIEAAISSIQEELTRKPAYQAEFEQAESELAQAEKLTQEQETRLGSLRKDKEALENKKAQLAELAAHHPGYREKL